MSKKIFCVISTFAVSVASAAVASVSSESNVVSVKTTQNTTSGSVFFKFNSATLETNQEKIVQENAGYLNKNSSNTVRLEGNTGNKGSAKYDVLLGKNRALAVKDKLVKLGVNPSNIEVVSNGGSKAIPGLNGARNNDKNYRVDFINTTMLKTESVVLNKVDEVVESASSKSIESVAPSIIVSNDKNNNMYVNLNSGVSFLNHLPTGAATGAINAGYEFNKYFATEAGYNLFISRQYGTTQVNTNFFDIAVKGTLSLSDSFSLYGRAGLGLGIDWWTGSVDYGSGCYMCTHHYNSGYMGALLGAGLSYQLSKSFSLRLEDYTVLPFGTTLDGPLNATTAGVQYNF